MTRLQKILLVSGGLALLILSSILFFMYRNVPENNDMALNGNIPDSQVTSNYEDVNGLNITNRNENVEREISETKDEDLQHFIDEAISKAPLNPTYTEPTEQSLYEHAYLYQYVTNLVGDRLSIEEELDEESEWIAKELYAWIITATEIANFQYNEVDFISFVQKENYLKEDDLQTTAILTALKEKNESLYIRHLEFHYIKPYIWSVIESEFQKQFPQDKDETDEDYTYRLYLQFQENVTDYLIQKYPELMQ